MSASAKRPRTPEEIARILIDAETFGVAVSAERNGCHRNTVRNLRDEWATDARVVRACAKLRGAVSDGWIEKAKLARSELLNDVLKLAGRTKNLRSATEALRRVGELCLASDILDPPEAPRAKGGSVEEPDEGGGGAEPLGPDREAPPRAPQGKGARRGKGTRH